MLSLYGGVEQPKQARRNNNKGRVCGGGPAGPCARGSAVALFAALAQFGARLRGTKNDACAWPWRNAARVRFSRARLRAALAGRFRMAAGWLMRARAGQ